MADQEIKRESLLQLLQEGNTQMKTAAAHIRTLEAENAKLKRTQRAQKLAQHIEDKGLALPGVDPGDSPVERMEGLSSEDFDKLEGLVEMATPYNPLASFEEGTDSFTGDVDDAEMNRQQSGLVQFLSGNMN